MLREESEQEDRNDPRAGKGCGGRRAAGTRPGSLTRPRTSGKTQVGWGRAGSSCQLTFTVCHIRKPSNQHADPWHHLVILMQDLHAVHREELVLLGQAVQQQHRVPQTPHCPLLLVSPWGSPCPPHCQPLSVQHHRERSDHLAGRRLRSGLTVAAP